MLQFCQNHKKCHLQKGSLLCIQPLRFKLEAWVTVNYFLKCKNCPKKLKITLKVYKKKQVPKKVQVIELKSLLKPKTNLFLRT